MINWTYTTDGLPKLSDKYLVIVEQISLSPYTWRDGGEPFVKKRVEIWNFKATTNIWTHEYHEPINGLMTRKDMPANVTELNLIVKWVGLNDVLKTAEKTHISQSSSSFCITHDNEGVNYVCEIGEK